MSAPDTTIDSEPTLEQIATYWKGMGWEIHPNALKEITRLIAQEANKARIDELKLHQGEGGWIDIEEGEVTERIKELQALTSEKEQA